MDALSFVLGVRSAQLRSTQLKDLIYRGGVDDDDDADDEEEGESNIGKDASTASVTAVYRDRDDTEYQFKRR